MCLAYRSLRAATNKYGVAHYHTLSRFPRNVGNVRSRQRCSQMSVLCWVPTINNNQQHAYIIPLLSTSTYTRRKERWIRKREAVFWKRLESKHKAQSGKAIKQFCFNMNVEFDFYGKRLESKYKSLSQAQTALTLNGGETDKRYAAVFLLPFHFTSYKLRYLQNNLQ